MMPAAVVDPAVSVPETLSVPPIDPFPEVWINPDPASRDATVAAPDTTSVPPADTLPVAASVAPVSDANVDAFPVTVHPFAPLLTNLACPYAPMIAYVAAPLILSVPVAEMVILIVDVVEPELSPITKLSPAFLVAAAGNVTTLVAVIEVNCTFMSAA